MRIAVVGAGWAGLACAVGATRAGHAVTLYEAARQAGGRARRIDDRLGVPLDNGQHILIGAYSATLALMREVGVDRDTALLRLPLSLRFADGGGLNVPASLPAPLDLLAGIALARGWNWRDKMGLLRTALHWQRSGFRCAPERTVAQLCAALTPRVGKELIEPLCVSALNTPVAQASGEVFLRVLQDALFGERGGADLLLPRVDLGALLPGPALRWLATRGTRLHMATRVQAVTRQCPVTSTGWQVDGTEFDRIVLACPPWEAARIVRTAKLQEAASWLDRTEALQHESIATVYAMAHGLRLRAPMLALRSNDEAPAQFVLDRGQLGGPVGLLAFVVSASNLPRDVLQAAVLRQASAQLGLQHDAVDALQTVVEKRATFACTPALVRPALHIAPGLLACGDYVEGPYPATIEGAVRSGSNAASAIDR